MNKAQKKNLIQKQQQHQQQQRQQQQVQQQQVQQQVQQQQVQQQQPKTEMLAQVQEASTAPMEPPAKKTRPAGDLSPSIVHAPVLESPAMEELSSSMDPSNNGLLQLAQAAANKGRGN